MSAQTSRILFICCLAVVLLWPPPANADRITRLVRILKTEESYKVRLQVCITLGKLKDRRAVPALVRALSDKNYTVRGVAAAALAQIGDRRAVPPLKRSASSDRHEFVRSQAKKAVTALLRRPTGPPAGTRYYITVGKPTNKTKIGGKRLAAAFGDALADAFSGVAGVTTEWGGGRPTARELRKHKLKGFILDGSILKLEKRRSGSDLELSCSIRVSLATYPGNSMKAFYSGGASMAVSASSFQRANEENLFREIIEGAAEGAKQHIVRSYLSSQ